MDHSLCEENEIIAPKYFNILSQSDKEQYIILQKYISNSEIRYKRYKKVESLKEALCITYNYCIRNDLDDMKRCFVCGVFWIGNDIAINTKQLSRLISKCKPSINGTLSDMGYRVCPINNQLNSYIQFLSGNIDEQKQWNIRKKVNFSFQI